MKSFTDLFKNITILKDIISDNYVALNNSLSKDNLENLGATCRIIEYIENNYPYTEEELKILIDADQKNDLTAMKKGVLVKLKPLNYRTMIEDLNKEGDDNLFSKFKKLQRNKLEKDQLALTELEDAWKRRSQLAHLSSPKLQELTKLLEKLDIYVTMLESDFRKKTGSWINAWNWIHPDRPQEPDIQSANECIANLKTLIASKRIVIAQAMLERLMLIPGAELIELNYPILIELNYPILNACNKNKKFKDDLVLATLQELTPFGLDQEFVNNFESHPTLDKDLIGKFNDFIRKYGNNIQTHTLWKIYSHEHQWQKSPKDIQPFEYDPDTILIPTSIANHYTAHITIDDNSNDNNKDKLIESFTVLEKSSGNLDMSFYDSGESKTVHISIDKLSHHKAKYKKEILNKEKFEEFYDVLTQNTIAISPPNLTIDNFVIAEPYNEDFVLKNLITTLTKHAETLPDNQHEFIEAGKAILRSLDWGKDPTDEFNIKFQEFKNLFQLKQKFLQFLDKECERIHSSFNPLADSEKTEKKINTINNAIILVKIIPDLNTLKDFINKLTIQGNLLNITFQELNITVNANYLLQNRRFFLFGSSSQSTFKENLNEFIESNNISISNTIN